MSFAYEDWKWFFNLSGQAVINDALGDDDNGVYCSVLPGEWAAICEYDDSNAINYVVMMHEQLANKMGERCTVIVDMPNATQEHRILDSRSGIVFITDRRLKGKLPESFTVAEDKKNPDIVERFGDPNDKSKPDADRFMESCFHIARDYKSNMPLLDTIGYGAAFELSRGKVSVNMLYNETRDVVGLEISRED